MGDCRSNTFRFHAPKNYRELVEYLQGAIVNLNPDVQEVYISAPGLVDSQGYVRRALYSCITDQAFPADMQDRLNARVIFENDARCQALGCMRPSENLVYLSFGTGVGGAAIIGGRPFCGRNGSFGEFGHIALLPTGPQCICGKLGCIDSVAGGKSLERLLGLDWWVSRERQETNAALLRVIGVVYKTMDILRTIFDPARIVLAGHLCVRPEFKAAVKNYAVARSIEAETLSDTWPLVLQWASRFDQQEI